MIWTNPRPQVVGSLASYCHLASSMVLELATDRALSAQQERVGPVQNSVMKRPGAGGGRAGRSRALSFVLAHAGSASTGASCTGWTLTSWYARRLQETGMAYLSRPAGS